jgi:hypothetical protein
VTHKWKSYTYENEYRFVKYNFIPFLQNQSMARPTVFDLGHHTLYFYKALVKYLIEETNFSFVFVRIRRDRHETAMSLMYGTPGVPWTDMCSQLMFRLCPQDRTDEVINKVSTDVWGNFTNFQRALWMVDEIEARWRQLKAAYPKMEHLEVLWGKCWPESFSIAATKIGKLIGVHKPITVEYAEEQHRGSHVGNASSNISHYDYALQDIEYRSIMGFL